MTNVIVIGTIIMLAKVGEMMTIKELRIKMGLSQVQMARLLNVSINTFINWDRGVINPNEENQKKIDNLMKKYSKGE